MTQASTYSVKDLAQFMKREHENGQPFVFFTGAGCSFSAGIPLAGKLVEEMNKRYELELKVLSAEDRKDYGKCMAQIGRDERRKFLKGYIQNAKINWAHIALASLLESGYISRVLTFNFDNLLARSCGLLGLYPATYDLTAANLNLYGLIDNPAIVHLHGQSHGFVQLNSNQETLEHAESLKSFICSTLNSAPTVFIGYSGLADAFFNNIKSNFVGQHRLFWVGMEESPLDHVRDLIAGSSLANYMRCVDGADLFLIELAQELKCFPPSIFQNPYQHLLDELNPIADYPAVKRLLRDKNLESDQDDIDILIGLKERLKKAKEKEVRVDGVNVLDLYLQGKYKLLIELAVSNQKFDVADRVLVAKSFIRYALNQEDENLEIRVYDQLIYYFGGEDFVEIREQVAKAYLYKAFTFHDMKKIEDEVITYDLMLEFFTPSSELVLQEQVAAALVHKGVTLGQLNRLEEEIAIYDDLVARFGTSSELGLQEQVAYALLNKGVVLGQLNRFEESIAVYNDFISRFGVSTELVLQEPIAKVLVNKGFSLSQLNLPEEAISVYDDLINRFGTFTELVLQEKVAKASLNKGLTLSRLNRSEEAISVYDDLINRFGTSTDLVLQEEVAKILVSKGVALGQLNRSEEEISVYNDLISRFGTSAELALQDLVAKALVNKGLTLLSQLNRSEEAVSVCDDLMSRFGTSTELGLQDTVAQGLLNKGVALGQLNRSEEEVSVYNDLISRFGASAEFVLQDWIAKALVNKGLTLLGQLNLPEEAILVYDDLMSRFGNSPEASLQTKVVQAKNGKGFALLLKAKAYWSNQPQALASLQEALPLLQQAQATAADEQQAMILGNLAYVYWLLGDEAQATTHLKECLTKGGEYIYHATLEDIATHPIPPDAGFKALLEELWQAQQSPSQSE